MPSKRRRSKRRKGPVNVVAWLWGLFVLNVVAGLAFSPLTAVQKVRVWGLPVAKQQRVIDELQAVVGVPMLRLNKTSVAYRLGDDGEVDSVTFFPNIFGRAVVRYKMKDPVAKVRESELCLDPSGTPFLCSVVPDRLPIVLPPPRALATSLTFLGGWDSGQTAQLCQKLTAQMPNVEWTVAVGDRGIISLQAGSSGKVVLGAFARWPKKIEKLKGLLDEQPDIFQKVRQLDLNSPESPVFVHR